MAYKHLCVIDAQNLYKTFVRVLVIENEEGQEEQIQHYKLLDGEQLVGAAPPTMRPYAGVSGFVRPKWDAVTSAWTEAATEEEIAAWEDEHPAPAPIARKPSETEQLRADVDYLAIMTGVEL